MNYLFICLLVLGAGLVGCNTNKTGYECWSCKKEVARNAKLCPHCGQGGGPANKVGE
jgi:rRNA maturation endonuclease Nob1